jgi:hypothetical protein
VHSDGVDGITYTPSVQVHLAGIKGMVGVWMLVGNSYGCSTTAICTHGSMNYRP